MRQESIRRELVRGSFDGEGAHPTRQPRARRGCFEKRGVSRGFSTRRSMRRPSKRLLQRRWRPVPLGLDRNNTGRNNMGHNTGRNTGRAPARRCMHGVRPRGDARGSEFERSRCWPTRLGQRQRWRRRSMIGETWVSISGTNVSGPMPDSYSGRLHFATWRMDRELDW
jgi:hypothetical protein